MPSKILNKRVAYLIATGIRYDDSLILQEIIKNHYKNEFFIIHSVYDPINIYNKYLEDILIKNSNNLHQSGTWISINETLTKAYELGFDYAIYSHADTWILDEKILLNWLSLLINSEFVMVNTHSYKYTTLSTDFFIVNIKKIIDLNFFPTNLTDCAEVDEEMYQVMGGDFNILSKYILNLEPRQLWMRSTSLYRNREECIPLSLVGHHFPCKKKDRLKEHKISPRIGDHTRKFLTTDMLSYYNFSQRINYQAYN